MTDEILKLNANNELIAEDPDTGNVRPVQVADLSASGDVSATNVTADTQMNSSSTRPDVFADTVDANQLTGVTTGGVTPVTHATPTSVFDGPSHGQGGGAFQGATVAPDGRVIFAPRDSPVVGIFDPSSNSFTSGPTHGQGGSAFQGATVAPDGRVIFAPNDSPVVGGLTTLPEFAFASTSNLQS